MKDSKKRITFLAACHNIGGFETKLDNLVRNLDPNRFEANVLLIYPFYKAKKTPEKLRNRQRDFFFWRGVRTTWIEMRHRFDFIQIFQAASILKLLKPDIVLFFALGPGTFIAPVAARMARVPVTIRLQDTIPEGMYPKLLKLLDRLLLSLTARCVVPSCFLKTLMVQNFGIHSNRISVIPNGIDLEKFRRAKPVHGLKRSLGFGGKTKIVGMIANLVPVKNHFLLLDAIPAVIRRFPNVLFLLLGDGPLRSALEQKAAEKGISGYVRFLGYRSDVENLIPLFDIGILCSEVEVHPISLIEMMACGVPVAAPKTGGIPEIIRDRVNGLLFPPGDSEALARTLLVFLQSPTQAERYGESGRISVLRFFSVNQMIRSFEALLGPALKDA
jgi:glycosyltransferase involved in cell wall biosynthesis